MHGAWTNFAPAAHESECTKSIFGVYSPIKSNPLKNIVHQKLNLPADVPVMVLPNAALFPNTLLPLYIFELRYRAMLSYCLERSRMFCIAMMKPGITEAVDDGDFYHMAGLGLIRACVGNTDGTSQLMLQGIARVNLKNFIQHEPYRIAQIQELRSETANPVEAEALGIKLLELCRELKETNGDLQSLLNKKTAQSSNPEIVSDFVAQAFITNPLQKQQILEELSVSNRLRMLIQYLRE
jgi:Lon protease-like protein